MPDDKLPRVTVQVPYTPATYNTPDFTDQVMAGLKTRFDGRVFEVPSVMGGEDFGQFLRADPDNIKSLIFWVGGAPMADWERAQKGEIELPSLHSPFWAPDAPVVNTSTRCTLAEAAAGGTPITPTSKVWLMTPNAIPSAQSTICAAKPMAMKGSRSARACGDSQAG